MRTLRLSLVLALVLLPAAAHAQFDSPTVCWDFEESSGTRAPTVGTTNLSVTGSVGSAAGKSGNAADIPGTSGNYLSATDNAEMSVPGDISYSWAAWTYFDATSGLRPIVVKDTSLYQYWMYYYNVAAADTLTFRTNFNQTATLNPSGLVTGAWRLVAGYHDTSNNLNGISYDGAAFTTGASAGTSAEESGDFVVGADGAGNFFDGRIDMLVMWKGYVLTSGDLSTLKAGAGTCAEITGGPPPSSGGPRHTRLRGWLNR